MAYENLSKYYPIVMKFSGYLPLYIRTRVQLILDLTGRTFKRDMGPKWDTTNYIAEVCVSETGMLRGVTATSPSITW